MADLVLLKNNPLENIAHSKEIAGVMIWGRYVAEADIAKELKTLEEK